MFNFFHFTGIAKIICIKIYNLFIYDVNIFDALWYIVNDLLVNDKLNELNLEIYNVDTVIICEEPKINPHRDNILKSLSLILEIPIDKIGLKATTSEQIGIIGKNKAIAVQSYVNLREKR